jgi:hypothetical protein
MALLFTQNPNSPRYFWPLNAMEPRDRFVSPWDTLQSRKVLETLRTLKSLLYSKTNQKVTFSLRLLLRTKKCTTHTNSARKCTHHVYTTFTEGRYRNPEMRNRSKMTSLPGVKPGALEYSFSIHHFLPIKASINILLNQYFIISSKTGPTT